MSIEDNSRDPADRNPSQREFALARQMEKDIREASVTGDALKYFLACDKWGVELPGDSLYDVGKDQYEAAQIIKQRKNLERELTSGDVLFLCSGGHGFKILESTEMIEVKQGPYSNREKDKEEFGGI